MPSGATLPPRGFPRYFPLFRRLPERKVVRVPLRLVVFDAHAVKRVVRASARELSVGGTAFHIEIHVAVLRRISVPLFDQLPDKRDDVADVLRRFEPEVGFVDLGAAHHRIDIRNHAFGVFVGGNARLFGSGDDLVVYVGIVAGVCHPIALLLQKLTEHIVDDRLIGVPDMRLARNRDPAGVHFDLTRFERNEFFFSSRKRIIQLHSELPLAPPA